jgi:hypothetical protein
MARVNDIFLSYESSDRPIAHVFADTLEARGWSVWWDREIPLGKNFDEVIERELMSARCVVVLWSKQSVRSRWVRTEASAAAERGCLVPVAIDDTSIPLEFRQIQAAILPGWNGDTSDPEFIRLTDAIEALLKEAPVKPVASPSPSLPAVTRARTQPWQTRYAVAALALLVVVLLAVAMFMRSGENAGGMASVTSSDPLPPGASPASSAADGNANTAGAFTVTVNARIADGVPGRGAGVIESVGGLDTYVFEARPGQRVYFHTVRVSEGVAGARWVLTDADGMKVFDTCLGCTAGVQDLIRGGRYTLTVGANGNGTGSYELRLFDVPPPEKFALSIGATVQDDEPGRGAGAIQSPGAEDIFAFRAEPRERLYFRMLEHSPSAAGLSWRLTDADGTEVFNTCLGCGDPGVQRLSKGGEYTLTVGSSTNVGTGSYRLRLTRVPAPQRFAVKLPARIASGVPAAGAGTIEVPGAEDVYVFDAAPGQRVRFRSLERDRAVDGIYWRLVDHNGNEVFNSCLGCGEPGEQRLTAGGSYELIVGHTGSAATGAYSIAAEPAN